MKKILSILMLLVAIVTGAWAASGDVLFSQNFNSAEAVAYDAPTGSTPKTRTYNSTNPLQNLVGTGSNLFTNLTTDIKKGDIAINSSNGGNKVDASGIFQVYSNGDNAGYWSIMRTADFATTAPTAIKVTVDIWYDNLGSGSENGIQFAIGNGFTGALTNSCPAKTSVHSGFGLYANSSVVWKAYEDKNTTLYNTALTQSAWHSVTWVINNTGEALTYDNPTGTGTTELADDCFDIWLKTQEGAASTYTLIASGKAATTGTIDLQEIYIGNKYNKKHEFRLDNIVVTDLTPTSGPVAVTGVTVDETESVEENKTVALTATVAPANATNKNVTWSSDDETIATVDENGVVTGVAAGTANITVKTEDGEFTDVCVVTVTAPKADSECAFGETEPSINLIGTATGTYTQEATTATGYDGTVTYDLSNNTCGASINETTHEVTVTKSGSVTVTATAPATAAYAGSSASYTLTVSGELTAESNRTWDFTDATVFTDATSADQTYTAETYVNNVMIGNGVQLMKKTGDADNKIQRLKLNQQGAASGYYVKIKVAAHSKVTVSAVGGSSRKIYFAENAVGGTKLAEYSCTENTPTDKVLEDSGDGEKVICIYNSASGNITLYSITVEPVAKEITLSDTDDKTKGFATFCSAKNFTVSGASAYKASINSNKIVLTPLGNEETVIPAEAGIIIAGDKGATATVTYTTADATANMDGNSLKGTTARVATSTLKNAETDKVVGFFKTPSAFKSYTGENFPANLAYFLLTAENAVESFDIVFEGEATAITNVNAYNEANSAAPVKVIKNGKLYIGNYNVAGQLVK